MTEDKYNSWKQLAIKGDWAQLVDVTKESSNKNDLVAVLWRVKAFRALCQGEEANNLLLNTTKGKLDAKINVAFQLAEELINSCYFKQAEPIIKKFIENNIPEGYLLKAAFYRELSKFEEALEALIPLKKINKSWENTANLSEAWIKIKQSSLKSAEECLKISIKNDTPTVHKLIARFELNIGQTLKAKNRLEKIRINDKNDWETLHLLAAANASLGGEIQKSIELVKLGLLQQPRHAESWALICKLYLSVGSMKEAQEAMAKSLSIKPWLDTADIAYIENQVSHSKYEEAEKLLNQTLKLASTPKRKAVSLDLMRLKSEEKRKIIKLADLLSIGYYNYPDVLRSVAAAYIVCNQRDSAATVLENIFKLNPYDKSAQNNLAALYKDRGDLDDAIKLWRNLAENGDEIARLNLAQGLIENGEINEAEQIFSSIPKKNDKAQNIIKRGMAEIFSRKGDLSKAYKIIKEVKESEENNIQNWILYARIIRNLDGISKSSEVLNQYLKRYGLNIKICKELLWHWKDYLAPDKLLQEVKKWREENKENVEYILLEAVAAMNSLRFIEAENILMEAEKIDYVEGNVALIRFLIKRGRFEEAENRAVKWVKNDSKNIRAWAQLTEVYFTENEPQKALNAVNEALEIDKYRLSLIRQKVGILSHLKKYDEAANISKELWDQSLEFSALYMWLRSLERNDKYQEAVNVLENIIKQKPNDIRLLLRYARNLNLVGKNNESNKILKELHNKNPDNDLIAQNLIRSLVSNDYKEEAVKVLRDFSSKQPLRYDLQVAIANLGLEQGLVEESRKILLNVKKQVPEMLAAWISSAMVERRAENIDEEKKIWKEIGALFPVHRWIEVGSDHLLRLDMEKDLEDYLNHWRDLENNNPKPWWAACVLAQKLSRFKVASDMLDGIEKRVGKTAAVYSARANIASESYRMADAVKYINEAVLIEPIDLNLIEQQINIELKSGNWDNFDKRFEKVCFLASDQKYRSYAKFFFNLNCHPCWEVSEIYKYYKEWGENISKNNSTINKKFTNKLTKDKKLKIGYISPDFRQHAVAKFTLPIIENHKKNNIEIYGYAYLKNSKRDSWTDKFERSFDHWCEIQNLSIDEIENKIRLDNIDILIDLAGHTSNNQLNIMSRRAAPIQASHVVGAGQTTGLTTVDYLIASEELWPEVYTKFATEKIEKINHKGMIYKLPEDALEPTELPSNNDKNFILGVFSRPLRVSRINIKVWVQILMKIPNSIIRFEHAPYLEKEIQKQYVDIFASYGLDSNRLQFCNTRPYWKAFQNIDILLDTFPAGSGTTSIESLFMERLVVSMQGRPTMGLTTHSQLVALELENYCSAINEEDYINKVINLIEDKKLLNNLSRNLRKKIELSPIIDYQGYVSKLESTYRSWWQKYCSESS